jgi:ankyrin repeat protein
LDGESYTDRCEAQEETNICEQLGFNEFLHQMLCEAASDGDVDTVAFAISCGADVNALDNFQRHALHLAVFAGHTNVVSLLLEAGADVNICDLSSKPPLMSAVTLFWDYGADPDEECSTGDDVLSMSIFKKQFAIARLVIDYGAPVLVFHVVSAIKRRADSSFLEMLIEKCKDFKSPSCGHTALASAVSASRMDIVHMLVERGAEINPPSLSAKQYAIVRAAESGCTEIMNYLIRHGAKLDLPTEEQTVGNGALHRAARRGHPGIIRLLLQHGIQVNNGTLKLDRFRTRHTMLCDAARHGNLECVQILLQNGVGLDARCGVGHTALLEAAEWYRDEVVQYLLSQGADVNVQDKDGHTPLCRNLYWSRPTGPATFCRLLEAGANPDGCISCAVKVEKYIERLCGTSCGYLRY